MRCRMYKGENVAGSSGRVYSYEIRWRPFSVFRWRCTSFCTDPRRCDVREVCRNSQVPASILIAPNVLIRLLTNLRATVHDSGVAVRSATDHSQALRITRELMRLDQGFAQAVRTGLSMNEAVPGGGPITRTAETVKKA